MAEQKKAKGRPGSASRGSQKNHRAIPAREKHPERKLLRILQSNGEQLARDYAKHFKIESELDKTYFLEALERVNRRKEDRRSGLVTPPTQPQAE